MNKKLESNNQIISYQLLRMFIGLIGILLPVIIIAGQWIQNKYSGISNSISASYYTKPYGDILVGSLFVLGFFLLSYRGKNGWENGFANSGFFFSLGIALFPCQSAFLGIKIVHYISAGSLFLMFALFSLWLFRKSTRNLRTVPHLLRIDNVYIVTGIILILCLLGLGVFVIFVKGKAFNNTYKPVLFIEAIGLISFGYAWMTRAHVLWRDREEYPKRWSALFFE